MDPSSLSDNDAPCSMPSMPLTCSICDKQAYGMNYGVISCNACKMFFRRMSIQNPKYQCKGKNGKNGKNKCYQDLAPSSSRSRPRCQSCRFSKCLSVGMRYGPTDEEGPATNTRLDTLCNTVTHLLHLDSKRTNLSLIDSEMDPTLDDLIDDSKPGFSLPFPLSEAEFEMKMEIKMKMKMKKAPSPPQVLAKWSFLGIWTSVEFHNNLQFMTHLNTSDKKILLKSFAVKSYLLSSAFRCYGQKSECLLNPDGSELFPELHHCNKNVASRIRNLLVSRLETLQMTAEEYILVLIILFCNPALPDLSPHAQEIISAQQQLHSKMLLDHSLMTWNAQGPVRWVDIVYMTDILQKCYEDVRNLVEMLQIFQPNQYTYKKLFIETLEK